jgi:hypothetical protein
LAFFRDEFAEVNAAFRAETNGQNVVLREPYAGYIGLACNPTSSDEPNYNPLIAALPAKPPLMRNALSVVLGDALEPLGWEFRDAQGRLVETLEVGHSYHLRTLYRVLDTLTTDWQIFVHLDGKGWRQNGDHDPVNGTYPTDLWQPGDVILDDYLMQLDSGILPGRYRLYSGFFRNTRRLEVTRGNHDDNRFVAGDVDVR